MGLMYHFEEGTGLTGGIMRVCFLGIQNQTLYSDFFFFDKPIPTFKNNNNNNFFVFILSCN